MLRAILQALRRAVQRDLGTFRSIKVNNFFLFTALLAYSAVESGLPPWSAYPFLILLALPMLFPLSSDPLDKIPPERLASWPIRPHQRLVLRLAGIAFSPIFWLALVFAMKTGSAAIAVILIAAVLVRPRLPQTNLLRHIPLLPGRLGGLITNNLRGILSVLDTWVALLLSVLATWYRLLTPNFDPAALPILAMLIALALSTQTQSLFGLDYGSGTTLYRMLPLKGRQILLAKDVAWLSVLLILIAPLNILPALTFGLAALVIGHHSSVHVHLPQQRLRFAGGRLLPAGALQIFLSVALGFAEMRRGLPVFFATAGLYAISLWYYGRTAPGAY
jgi:hypothetical protein